jgi:DNA-3-methyladenine glycosylase I
MSLTTPNPALYSIDPSQNEIARCPWCGKDPIYVAYHDNVWGVPERDSHALFAKLILDGAQAGLSWITILKREQGYFDAFDGLDPEIMAEYGEDKIEELMQNPGIIRNRTKIVSAIKNARAYLSLAEKGIAFNDFLWQFTDGLTIQNHFKTMAELPAETPLSIKMSKALKAEGFTFVGPTIVYAFMQAVGMVNDHLTSCHRYPLLSK